MNNEYQEQDTAMKQVKEAMDYQTQQILEELKAAHQRGVISKQDFIKLSGQLAESYSRELYNFFLQVYFPPVPQPTPAPTDELVVPQSGLIVP